MYSFLISFLMNNIFKNKKVVIVILIVITFFGFFGYKYLTLKNESIKCLKEKTFLIKDNSKLKFVINEEKHTIANLKRQIIELKTLNEEVNKRIQEINNKNKKLQDKLNSYKIENKKLKIKIVKVKNMVLPKEREKKIIFANKELIKVLSE